MIGMAVLRRITLILFLIVLVIFGGIYYTEWRSSDDSAPVISFDQEEIHVGLTDDEGALLRGVTAYDEKDGDLTHKLYVESVSRFVSPGVSTVTYAVCDSNNRVTTRNRIVVYDGYESPKFALSQSMMYRTGATIRVRDRMTAIDCLEGDLSQKIVLGTTDMNTSREGIYTITAKVQNSKSDVVELELPVVIENGEYSAPEIQLTEYLIYADVGEKVDPMQYVKAVTEGMDPALIKTELPENMDHPGCYLIHYYLTDEYDRTGHQVLIVVVGDGKEA